MIWSANPMTRLSILALIAVALVMSACGSGEPSSTATEATAGMTTQPSGGASTTRPSGQKAGGEGGEESATKPPAGDPSSHFTPPHHTDSASGAGQFKVKGGDNSIAEFGGEASGADFAEAAEALHGYLDARAAGAWAAACGYLAPSIRSGLVQQFGSVAGQKKLTCARVIATLSALPEKTLRESAVADASAFRAEGDEGFILFIGARKVRYFASMKREDGRWWVAAPAPSALP